MADWSVRVHAVAGARAPAGAGGGLSALLAGQAEADFEYIFDLSPSCDGALLAAPLSTHAVRVYDRGTLSLVSELRGHEAGITDTCFSLDAPHLLTSASLDGTVRLWDARTGAEGARFSLGRGEGAEAWSSSLGCGNTLLAVGGESAVTFFDVQGGRALGAYQDMHTEPVRQARFHPARPATLVTGSEDGLVCVANTTVGSEAEAVEAVMPAESGVLRLGFFGPQSQGLFVLTRTETCSLWDLDTAQRLVDHADMRAQFAAAGAPVDCLVDCSYSAAADRLLLFACDQAGTLRVVQLRGSEVVPFATLSGGHVAAVRGVDWTGEQLLTAGEDARLCEWRPAADAAALGEVRAHSLALKGRRPKQKEPYARRADRGS